MYTLFLREEIFIVYLYMCKFVYVLLVIEIIYRVDVAILSPKSLLPLVFYFLKCTKVKFYKKEF